MPNPLYSNGATPHVGDIIAIQIGTGKFPFVVTAIGSPSNNVGAGTVTDPSQAVTAVPFDYFYQLNVNAAATELWSDAYPGSGTPTTPHPFRH